MHMHTDTRVLKKENLILCLCLDSRMSGELGVKWVQRGYLVTILQDKKNPGQIPGSVKLHLNLGKTEV